MYRIQTPVSAETIEKLGVGDKILLSGNIYAGRDAVLPRIVRLYEEGRLSELGLNLKGSVIFHSAVSIAGIGPTSSNKLEIEKSIPVLSKAGIRIHLGKGAIGRDIVDALSANEAAFAVMPPVTALLEDRTVSRTVVAYPELGMEAFYSLEVVDFPIIIAAVNGESIYK